MTYHTSNSPLCSPVSNCPCRHNQHTGQPNLPPTHPSAYNDTLTAPGQVLDARSIQQNNHTPLPSSAICWPSRTRNDGMTRTPPDSVQIARGYDQMNPLQLSYPRPSSFVGFSEYPSEAPDGQRGRVGRGGMHSSSSLERESPTPWQAGARDGHYSSLHPNAIIGTGDWCSTSTSSGPTTVRQPAGTFVSTIPPQPPGAPPVTQGACLTPGSASRRGNPYGSSVDASRDQVLRNLGRWLSKHEYLNTGQDPIIGHDCPRETDLLGIKGKTVFTAFFDHTDRKTFRCYVCSDLSDDLEVAIIHQRRAMHHQE